MARSARMAPVDAAWLHMDDPCNRMIITGVLELGGRLEMDRVHALLTSRLLAVYPRFMQRVEHGPLGEARWVDDERFDLRVHLHHVGLAIADGQSPHSALQSLVGQLMGDGLEPARPLWRIFVVDLPDGRSALIARIHHCLADGISLARVLLSLTDGADPVSVDHESRRRWTDLLRASADAGGKLLDSAVTARRLLALTDDPPTAIRGPLGPVKSVAWGPPIELQRIKALASGLGGTVNDVLLTILADALGRYLRSRQTPVEALRTLVPVNLRPLDQPIPSDLGNRFGLVFLQLPVGHQPPRERFRELKRRMDRLKSSTEPAVTHALLSAVGLSPLQLERMVVEVLGAKASLITTNVPGPREQRHIAGVPLEQVLFWVPQSGAVALGVSLFSYAGRVVWGVNADAGLVPNPDALIGSFDRALQDLERDLRQE
ncbi:MAG: wax ester/triacylglycerol synthase family O-acyltransferase [Myxococcota bacterium]